MNGVQVAIIIGGLTTMGWIQGGTHRLFNQGEVRPVARDKFDWYVLGRRY